MMDKFQHELSEAQVNLADESQRANRVQMELDAKDSEIEQLQQKLALLNSDTMSVSSGGMGDVNGDEMFMGK
jgi:multidrug resistance efflux pump